MLSLHGIALILMLSAAPPSQHAPSRVPLTGCTDGDGGNVPTVASYVIDQGGAVFVDACTVGAGGVREQICNNGLVTSVVDTCSSGMHCVNETISVPGHPGTWVSAKCQ